MIVRGPVGPKKKKFMSTEERGGVLFYSEKKKKNTVRAQPVKKKERPLNPKKKEVHRINRGKRKEKKEPHKVRSPFQRQIDGSPPPNVHSSQKKEKTAKKKDPAYRRLAGKQQPSHGLGKLLAILRRKKGEGAPWQKKA